MPLVRMLGRLAGLFLLVLLTTPGGVLCPRAALGAEAGHERVTLLYVARTTDLAEVDGHGGFARLAGWVKAERARGRANGHPVLFLHGGDSLSQGALAAYDEGAHQIDLLNALEADAYAAQARDYNHGEDVLSQRAAEAKFAVLASNVRDAATGAGVEGLEEALILPAGRLKVGLLSIIGMDDLSRTAARRTRALDPLDTARERAARLRDAGADLIVIMTSDRRGLDLELRASGIADIVLTAERPDMKAGIMLDGPGLLAAPASSARWAIALDIAVEPARRDADGSPLWHAQARIVDTAMHAPDPDMGTRVRAYLDRLTAQQSQPVLTLDGPADTRAESIRQAENGFANLLADAVRDALGADAVLLNAGVIRGFRTYAAGHVLTRGDLLTELPFRNRVLLVEVTGAQLRTALENALFDAENRQGGVPDGRFPVVANLHLTADLDRPPGGRLTRILLGGRPIEPELRYRVAVTDFMAGGGDGFTVLADTPRLTAETEADLLSTIVLSAFSRMRSATPATDGRLVLTGRMAPRRAGGEAP